MASTIGYTSPAAEPGDRWEIPYPLVRLRLGDVPDIPLWGALLTGEPLEFTDPDGRTCAVTSPEELSQALATLIPSDAEGTAYIECVSLNPRRFLFGVLPENTCRGGADPSEMQTDQGIRIAASEEDRVLLGCGLQQQNQLRDFYLSLNAGRLATIVGFGQLFSLPQLRDVELLDHQLKTVQTVLQRFRGRALLCDEVGLGKTVEAGICLLELVMRGLAQRVLVLTPPSLVEQWQGEMRRKFSLDFITHDDTEFRESGPEAWLQFDRILASYHTAKREPHRSAILSREWDMVIIDEVHHFRNRRTLLWRFASELRKRYILLLTATPVQNNLDELFNLVTLLEPGLLSTERSFQRQFVDRKDRMLPKNVEDLHERLSEVMVRNRRSSIGLKLTRRYAQTLKIALSPEERNLYEQVTGFVREHLRDAEKGKRMSRMAWLTLQKELGSCSQASVPTLEKLALSRTGNDPDRPKLLELAELGAQIKSSTKADRLAELLGEFPDQMVIFTQYRETLEMLHERLTEERISHAVFHGGLSRMQKEQAILEFRQGRKVLLSTESGSEGRNLQFCHAICNFDLPWNPMRIEQRVGRLSRIGQTRDVHIFNLVAEDTIEDAILYLLEAKIHMFELVVGEVDMILTNFEEEREFEDIVSDLWSESKDETEFYQQMEALGEKLVAAKDAYLKQRAYDDQLFGDRFSAGR